ncbi:MAG: hypothetical protein USCAAHI_01121 [Beijerinckiaceae bacterium]|nr:MAG: hypothetical protein USCAAHI_01121 [Beijerinckiaceae bacterium]
MGSCELRRLISQKTRNEAFVKNKAELVGLAANARIGEEIKLISKANKHQSPMAGTGIPHTSRLRLQKILVSSEATKYRLPEQPGQRVPAILASACVLSLEARLFSSLEHRTLK